MPSSRSARIDKARALLEPGIDGPGGVWADIGCGDGIFTAALYSLIDPPGSRAPQQDVEIYAVDKNQGALRALEREFTANVPGARVHTLKTDFTRPLKLPPLDGLLMANALHFVKDKQPLLTRLADLLKPGGRLIVVEYNTSRGNVWVPHPLDEAGFLDLARKAGLRQACIVSKIRSSFLGEMYAGVAAASR